METKSEQVDYLITQAKSLRKSDPSAAKAWIITAKTLFPNAFSVQFEAYKLEKEAKNYEEAAKCFGLLTENFQNQIAELWQEINALTTALRQESDVSTPEHDFYIKMFKHITNDVQHKVLMLTVNHTENSLEQCRLLLFMLNKFPQAATTHARRLLEMIVEHMKSDVPTYQKLLVEEALPLIQHKTPELPPALACRLYTISLEYYLRQIIEDETKGENNVNSSSSNHNIWKQIFKVLLICGKMQRWETFLPFNKSWGQNVYWEKLVEIISASPAGSTQVLFYATTLFIYSLHDYIKNSSMRIDDADVSHVLVEGFTEWKVENSEAPSMEPPQFSLTTPISQDLSKAFLHAAQCWQLLNTEQFHRDFSNLMVTLPLAPWISRFLCDLAIYFGHRDEAKKLMSEMTGQHVLVQSLQILSLNVLQGSLSPQGLQCIVKIIAELPNTQGQFMEHLTLKVQRHMIFIPLTQRALVQYCTKSIVNTLGRKLYEPNCSDGILGDLLVLLQLDYARETLMAEHIFGLINSRRAFSYHLLPTYITTIDFIEEIAYIWNKHSDECNFDFGQTSSPTSNASSGSGSQQRRIGTRGADKGVRDDFRAIIKQQVARANENVITLIINFISQENATIAHNLFGGGNEVIVIK